MNASIRIRKFGDRQHATLKQVVRRCCLALVVVVCASQAIAITPVITEVRTPPGVSLQEGRTVPLLIVGENIEADLTPSFEFTGQPAEFTFSHYTGHGTSAGVILKIPQLPFVGEGETLIGQLRLTAPDNSSAVFMLHITGLDEFVLTGGQSLTVDIPPPKIFSRVFIGAGATLRVTGGSLDWKCTGPVDIEGTIDASGNDGTDAAGRFGGAAGRNGASGGNGGYEVTGSGEVPPAAGDDAVNSLFGLRHVLPLGKGGAGGVNDGATTDSNCTTWDDGTCYDVVASLLEYYRNLELPIDRSFNVGMLAGVQGWSGGGNEGTVRPRPGRGGGGGGGGGMLNGDVGGGGGAGGDGGLGVRIVSGDYVRVSGNVTTTGGIGGNGSANGSPAALPDTPTLGQLAHSGGGGGGGGGGELILLGSFGGPFAGGNAITSRGGQAGQGGMYLDRNLDSKWRQSLQLPGR